ncbi:hypothetical protein JTB14_002254 [Gonioctena quinquepunctata]|nr:hypothetical protein JTB14_002254 [Gonioctena quinquepunctata]
MWDNSTGSRINQLLQPKFPPNMLTDLSIDKSGNEESNCAYIQLDIHVLITASRQTSSLIGESDNSSIGENLYCACMQMLTASEWVHYQCHEKQCREWRRAPFTTWAYVEHMGNCDMESLLPMERAQILCKEETF